MRMGVLAYRRVGVVQSSRCASYPSSRLRPVVQNSGRLRRAGCPREVYAPDLRYVGVKALSSNFVRIDAT
jgi:hypothetical protein